jgi:epoxyqueuosine reductase QueG
MEKKKSLIVDQIRKIAAAENIAVWGIGPASAMADEPSFHRPGDLLPGALSLICFALPVPKNVYCMTMYGEETVWRSQNLNYRHLDTMSLRLTNLLEESGSGAVPVWGCQPMGMNERGSVTGYLNQIRMAEVTGIGAIGKNGLLIHSRYGSRLMLGGVLTTAALPALCYPQTDEPGCPPDCQICADACPVKAIMPDRKQVKIMRCLGHTAKTPLMSRLKFIYLRARDKRAAARYMNMTSYDELTFHICSKCVALCPYGEGK